MDERPRPAPAEEREARYRARSAERRQRQALREAFPAGGDDRPADDADDIDAAVAAGPVPEAAAFQLYGTATRLVEELHAVTGEDRAAILDRVLR